MKGRCSVQCGIALVLVFWALALLTIIAVGLTTAQRTESTLAGNQLVGARFYALAEAGVSWAILNLLIPVTIIDEETEIWVPDGMPRSWTFAGETLLRMNNAALVNRGGTYEVVPLSTVRGRVIPQLGESSQALPAGYSVQVVPLRYIGAEEMSKILQPLAPEGSIIRVDNLRNMLVLAGTSPEIGNLLDTIQVFDVDWMSGLSVGFFTLDYATPGMWSTNSTTSSPMRAEIPSRDSSISYPWIAPTVFW